MKNSRKRGITTTKKEYVGVRIPKALDDLITKYMEDHKEEMILLDQRRSRAGIVKRALYEFLKREGYSAPLLRKGNRNGL